MSKDVMGNEEFDQIDLEFDKPETKKPEETEDLDGLNLEDLDTPVTQVEDHVEDLDGKKNEPDLINIDLDEEVTETPSEDSLESLDLDLGNEESGEQTEPDSSEVSNEEEISLDLGELTEEQTTEDSPSDQDENSIPAAMEEAAYSEEEISLDLSTPESQPDPSRDVEVTLPTPKEEPPAEPKKRGRKPKKDTVVNLPQSEPTQPTLDVSTDKQPIELPEDPKLKAYLNPLFDITLINPSRKYQTRAIERTFEQLKDFGEILKMQGQQVPVHIHKEGPEYFVVVGFGRYDALKLVKFPTIKAIVHEGLTDSELVALSTGSNECRLVLSEWDKIISVGRFAEEHPEIPLSSKSSNIDMTKIFGYGSEMLKQFIEHYKYFKDIEEFCYYLRSNPLPGFMIKVIYESRDQFIEIDKVIEFVNVNKTKMRKEFVPAFAEFLAQEKLVKAIIEKNTDENPNNDIDLGGSETSSPDGSGKSNESVANAGLIDKPEKAEIDKLVSKLAGKSETELKEDVTKIREVSEVLTQLNAKFGELNEIFVKLLGIDNMKDYMDNSRLNSLGNKVKKMNSLYLKVA